MEQKKVDWSNPQLDKKGTGELTKLRREAFWAYHMLRYVKKLCFTLILLSSLWVIGLIYFSVKFEGVQMPDLSSPTTVMWLLWFVFGVIAIWAFVRVRHLPQQWKDRRDAITAELKSRPK